MSRYRAGVEVGARYQRCRVILRDLRGARGQGHRQGSPILHSRSWPLRPRRPRSFGRARTGRKSRFTLATTVRVSSRWTIGYRTKSEGLVLSVPDRDDVSCRQRPRSRMRGARRGCDRGAVRRQSQGGEVSPINARSQRFEHLGRGVGVEGPDAAGSVDDGEADCGDRSSVRATVTCGRRERGLCARRGVHCRRGR